MVKLSASGYAVAMLEDFGGEGWEGLAGDYDGDGKTDLVVYQESTSTRFTEQRIVTSAFGKTSTATIQVHAA
ncbi:MAG: FG-GAP repeat protein [Kiritimatiellae bacterium]|nr:FG-GAP repeat protein [Kiritimatiellia bacterium]